MPAICRALALVLGIFAAAPATAAPRDFVEEARVMYRVVACGGADPLPPSVDARLIETHCATVTPWYATLEQRYLQRARSFLAPLRPTGLPATVVYPFGGGDLLSALLTYPEATEITTISLEHAGDPTRVTQATRAQLKTALAVYRSVLRALFVNHDSASDNLKKLERGAVPGQLAMFISALVAHGYEPVGLTFFELAPDGTVHHYSAEEVAALSKTKARRKKKTWVDTDFSAAFTNSELTFRKAGDPAAPLIVHRHIAANLADRALTGSPLLAYLEARGPRVVAMTKAASYLLWQPHFKVIRDYLLARSAWMVSDSTGIPPRYAAKAGLVQTTYGRFTGSYLGASPAENAAFRKLWTAQPYRKLGFRYGYPDAEDHAHLMITAPAAPATP